MGKWKKSFANFVDQHKFWLNVPDSHKVLFEWWGYLTSLVNSFWNIPLHPTRLTKNVFQCEIIENLIFSHSILNSLPKISNQLLFFEVLKLKGKWNASMTKNKFKWWKLLFGKAKSISYPIDKVKKSFRTWIKGSKKTEYRSGFI